MNGKQGRQAITALEIALVIVILLVLAIVGTRFYLGNYLVRKRVEQSHADLRRLAIAIEERFVDWSIYPIPREYLRSPEYLGGGRANEWRDYEELVKYLDLGVGKPPGDFYTTYMAFWPRAITTPVAYVAKFPADPFSRESDRSYGYMVYRQHDPPLPFILVGCGPDGDRDLPLYDYGRDLGRKEPWSSDPRAYQGFPRPLITYQYDPTNGLCSDGDIIRMQ